jgi:ribonucleoside-diphosphate reductase beta chain
MSDSVLSSVNTLSSIFSPQSPLLKSVDKDKYKVDLLHELAKHVDLEEAGILLTLVKERTSQEDRFSFFPIQDMNKYTRATQMAARLWSAGVIDFKDDLNDFLSLKPSEQQPLEVIFTFFSVMDGVATEVVLDHLIVLADTLEEKLFYAHQASNETSHAEAYGSMINDLIPVERREKIFKAVSNFPSIKRIKDWVLSHILAKQGKKRLYAGLVFMEMGMFMPLFCIIFWYKYRFAGKLKQIMSVNEYIFGDESLHAVNGADNYISLPVDQRFTDDEIHAIFREGIEVMCDFIRDIFAGISLTGINSESVIQYTKFVVDQLLLMMSHSKLYCVDNPFPWMESHKFMSQSNFFEKTVTDYSRFSVTRCLELAARRSGLIPDDDDNDKEEELFF